MKGQRLSLASGLAAPGDVDTAFGTGGIVTGALNNAGASDVQIQHDGKLVVVGSTGSCTEAEEEFSCHSRIPTRALPERQNPPPSF